MEKSFQHESGNFPLSLHLNSVTTIGGHSSLSTTRISTAETMFGNSSFPNALNTYSEKNSQTMLTNSVSNPDFQQVTESSFSSLLIGNILDAISLQDEPALKKQVACSCGEGTKAGYFCQDCNEYLCQKCVSAHNRVSLTKTHNIVSVQKDFESSDIDHFPNSCQYSFPYRLYPPENSSNTCKVHANEVLSFFCDTCSYPICTQCKSCDHKDHHLQFLENVIETNKNSIRAMISAAKNNLHLLESTVVEVQRTIDRVTDRSRIVKSDIQATIHKHLVALKQREVDLINKVEQISMLLHKSLKKYPASVDTCLAVSQLTSTDSDEFIPSLRVHDNHWSNYSLIVCCNNFNKQLEIITINRCHFKCQLLNAQMEQLKSMANKLKLSINEVSDVVNTGDGLQILKAKEKFQRDNTLYQDSGYVAEDDGILFIHPDASVVLALNTLGGVKSSVSAQQTTLQKDVGPPGSALCGSSVMFVIHARDHSGAVIYTKPEAFDASVKRPDNQSSRLDVLDSGNGRYVFNLHVPQEGEYLVSVQCRGVQIRDSPYLLKVKYSVNYKSRALTGAPSLIFGKEGDKPGELCRPWGICCDAKGFIIVADRSNNRIQIFKSDGSFYHMFGSSGSRPGQFDRPAGVAVDNKGHITVVDKDNHRVQIFRFDGTFVSTFGEKGSKNGQFNYPWDVDVNRGGVIAVTDTRNHRIQLFSFDGAYLSKYGFEGAMWKHFDSPRGVAFTHDNRLIVSDFNNHRLVIINPDMKSARYLGSEGSQTSQFLRPQGVAVDEEGNVVVADSRNHRLQVFTATGTLVAVFGGGLLEEGCPVQMDRPSGVAFTHDGHIAVVDFGNNRVVVF